jgi:predicted acylesterase/phospholipase RssA
MTGLSTSATDALSEAPLLRGASEHAIAQLRAGGREMRVSARDWLFRAGEPADRLFVVLSGRLQVLAPEDGRLLREVGSGAVLGELALLTESARSASARAVRDSRLLEIDAERFIWLVEEDGGFALSVARELARQLQESGGLELPETRPSVFAVVSDGSRDVRGFVEELELALGAWGTVAMLDGEGLEPDDFAAVLDRAEDRFGHVLLVDGAGPEWGEFCRRQCDRLLVMAGGEPPREPAPGLDGCELVLVGVTPGSVERWLDATEPRAHHVVASDAGFAKGVHRAARRLTQRSLGVVLSGGGARGFAHIGVLAALADAGFDFDRIGGCSMGAFIAAAAAVGHDESEIQAICSEELVRRSPFNDYTFPRVALIRSRKASAMLQRVFGSAVIEELERPLLTVSADLLSSRVVVHRRGPIADAVGASMSIPGLAPPLQQAGRLLVDGGVLNNLPVDHMAETAEGPILAVDVIRRLDEPSAEEPPLPTITETLARATVLGSVERAERNRALARLLVTPDVQEIGLREWSALNRAVEAGRHAATKALEAGGAASLQALLDAPV